MKIKLRVENGGHLPKLDGRRAQEHLVELGRRIKIWSSLPLNALAK